MYIDELIAASPRLERVCTSADEFGDVHMVRQDPIYSQQSSYIRMLILVGALLSFSPRSLVTIKKPLAAAHLPDRRACKLAACPRKYLQYSDMLSTWSIHSDFCLIEHFSLVGVF